VTAADVVILAAMAAGAALCWWASREIRRDWSHLQDTADHAAKRDHETWAETIGAGPVLVTHKKGVPQPPAKAPQPPTLGPISEKDDVPLCKNNGHH